MRDLTAFERQRLENIKNNQELLKTLGIGEPDAKIGSPPPTPPPTKPRPKKKKKVVKDSSSTPEPIQPTRKSSRSAARTTTNTSYLEIGQDGQPLSYDKRPKKKSDPFVKAFPVQAREPSRRSQRGSSNSKYQDWDTEDEDDVSYDDNGYKVLRTPESKPGLKRLQNPSPSSVKSRKMNQDSSPSSSSYSSSFSTDVGSQDVSDWIITTSAPKPDREALEEGQGKGAILFEKGYQHFRPNLTPEEMLKGGMQGGTAFKKHRSSVLDRVLLPEEDMSKFPSSWFEGIDSDSKLTSESYDVKQNRFKVKAGQTLQDWEAAGWINQMDPRGWWQWYFEFYQGRRTRDDERQIGRWLKACGPAGRFKRMLVQEIHRTNSQWDDESVKPVVRQTLWHWGYELNEPDWLAYLP